MGAHPFKEGVKYDFKLYPKYWQNLYFLSWKLLIWILDVIKCCSLFCLVSIFQVSEKSLLCHILKAVYKGMLSYYHNGDFLGDLGPPFLYFRLLEVFAQNWVPFWSPFLEFSGPLDILEQCNGRDFNNECFQSIVIVKNGRGEFCPALRVWWYYCIDFKIVAQLKFTFLVLAHLGYPIFNREALMSKKLNKSGSLLLLLADNVNYRV